jgi:hypothetical protein
VVPPPQGLVPPPIARAASAPPPITSGVAGREAGTSQAYAEPGVPSAEPTYEQPVQEAAPTDEYAPNASEQAAMEADDQVIMPAPPASVLAHHPRRPAGPRRHFVQTLAFKRAVIPVSFTLFAVCTGYVLIGLLCDSASPFAVLRSLWVAATLSVIGVVMLITCIVSMLQVKHEM